MREFLQPFEVKLLSKLLELYAADFDPDEKDLPEKLTRTLQQILAEPVFRSGANVVFRVPTRASGGIHCRKRVCYPKVGTKPSHD